MRHLRALFPGTIFVSALGLTYSMASTAMEDTLLDHSFFEETSLANANRGGLIAGDDLNVREYLLNNSFNLVWRKKGSDSPSGGLEDCENSACSSNGFLLNALLPDWFTEYHSEYPNYIPKRDYGGDEAILLVGVPLSFASRLFDQVNDWKTEVNESDKPVNLGEKSSKKDDHEFLFSHPWPVLSDRLSQDYLYTIGEESVNGFEEDIKKPYYFKVEQKNVDLVYAASDLSVNNNLLNLNPNSLSRSLLEVNREEHSKIQWTDKIASPDGTDYNFYVDFAVLRIKFPISDLRQQFIAYLMEVYGKKKVLPPVLNSNISIENHRIGPVYLGGWDAMTKEETDAHTMENLFLNVKTKTGIDLTGKTPSECSGNQFDSCFESKLYETYSARFSANPQVSTDYEVSTQKLYYPNDKDGILYVTFTIENKEKSQSVTREMVFSGFRQTSSDPGSEILRNYNEEKRLQNRKLIDFLEFKPKARARWSEHRVESVYFPYSLLGLPGNPLEQVDQESLFVYKGKHYYDISHHLEMGHLSLNNSNGMVALMKNPHEQRPALLGIYEGERKWQNPITGLSRKLGRITMFLSPFRYDLFNSNNNWSKPSLGDSLKKKKLDTKIVQTNRFRI